MSWFKTMAVGLLIASCGMPTARAQIQNVGPGSTVGGDQARGVGIYYQGLAWYELNAAKAREIDARTSIELERWNRQVYEA